MTEPAYRFRRGERTASFKQRLIAHVHQQDAILDSLKGHPALDEAVFRIAGTHRARIFGAIDQLYAMDQPSPSPVSVAEEAAAHLTMHVTSWKGYADMKDSLEAAQDKRDFYHLTPGFGTH